VSKRTNAPVIKPQLKIQFEQINFKVDTQTLENLRAYSEFIDSEQGYIIREALSHLFETDSAFQSFLVARSDGNKGSVQERASQ